MCWWFGLHLLPRARGLLSGGFCGFMGKTALFLVVTPEASEGVEGANWGLNPSHWL